jgi:hypothetical protein
MNKENLDEPLYNIPGIKMHETLYNLEKLKRVLENPGLYKSVQQKIEALEENKIIRKDGHPNI